MTKHEILTVITEWQNHILRIGGIEREYEQQVLQTIGSKPVKIITGFRRTGKSFLVQRLANRLIQEKTFAVADVLYLNFEDFRLIGINTPEKLDDIYRIFKTDIAQGKQTLLILDEIQKVSNWDRFIRTLYERDIDIEVILTGSNSELLSSELGSNLAGRFISFSILPFDFEEYLRYNGITVKNEADFYRNQEEIQKQFSQYLKYGGLPEICSIHSEDARFSYIEGIISKVILDDIISRFKVKHPTVVEKTLFYLLSGIGNTISFVRIGNYLKQLGIQVKQETIIHYVQYMLTAFALYEINKFDWKLGKIFAASRKYYAVDTGLVNLYPGTTSNYTKQLKNLVFLKLKRNRDPLYFGVLPSGKEIDFVVQHKDGCFDKYQVTQTLHDENYERELSPFIAGDVHFERGRNILLTLHQESVINYQGKTIHKKNLVKWLLGLS